MNSDMIHDRFIRIRNASGLKAKKSLLHEDMMLYLLYAYDPFKHYFIRNPVQRGMGVDQISDKTWRLLDYLADRKLTGYAAINALTEHLRELTPKSAALLRRIVDKNLRIGIAAKSINSKFPGLIPQHPIMLAKLINFERLRYPVITSPKLDGIRGIYQGGKFYSRLGNELTGLENVLKQIPVDFKLDGELVVPNVSFHESSGMLRSDNATPTAVFHIFDMPELNRPFHMRLIEMEDFLDALPATAKNIRMVPHFAAHDEGELMEYNDAFRNQGYEGSVVKTMEHMYQDKRSWDWQKIKDEHDEDLEVISYYEGKGKYRGMLGGVTVRRGANTVDVGGGYSDEQRRRFWERPREIVGRIIRVIYQEETPDGSLRHPRFGGIRRHKEVADDFTDGIGEDKAPMVNPK